MNARLSYTKKKIRHAEITISGSKSESNRLLILQALFPKITLENLSDSDDTAVLIEALKTTHGTVDVHHAGTAMRFLTAYYAATEGASVVLTGSERMQQRPIKILVDALKQLGADISYLSEEGHPPLQIHGKQLTGSELTISSEISSQFLSALVLIAPSLPNGLTLHLEGSLISKPYLEMTLQFLQKLGVSYHYIANKINISPKKEFTDQHFIVESDWSSASYFYSAMALSEMETITLKSLNEESFQGDSALALIYEQFGVKTTFNREHRSVTLSKTGKISSEEINLNLIETPDLAQTIAVTCLGLSIDCTLTGLQTLKIKETDRLIALKNELEKLGGSVVITDKSLKLTAIDKLKENIAIKTYQDHRMAMAFAPLAIKIPLVIEDAEVVSKSFPNFYDAFEKIGIIASFE